MLFVKFIRKVQFVQVRLFGDDPPGSQALCSWRRATQRDLLWPFSSSWRSGFRTASRDYFTSTGEGVSTSSLACRMLQKKERKRGKKKKKGGERWKLLLDHGKRTGGNRRIDEAPSMYIHWKSRANLFLWRDPWLFESLDLLMSF